MHRLREDCSPGTCLHMLCIIVCDIHMYEKINFDLLDQLYAFKHVLITNVNLCLNWQICENIDVMRRFCPLSTAICLACISRSVV